MRRGILIAGIVWLGLAVEILSSNVVFPAKTDNDGVAVVTSYLCVFAALFLTGVLAARDGASPLGQLRAGLVAGVMIGVLTVATFAVVDNVWLDIVAAQPAKVDGFARSGATSIRSYLNRSLIGPAVFLTVGFGGLGAVLALCGGRTGRRT